MVRTPHFLLLRGLLLVTLAAPAGLAVAQQNPAPGKPDVLRMIGPVSQDVDLRKLPEIPARQGYEPVRLMRHPEGIASQPSAKRAAPKNAPRASRSAAPAPLTPTPSLSFDGMDAVASGCGCLPPDTNGDVGPNHYIESVNSSIQIYNKSGATLVSATTYNSFFSALGASTPCGNNQNDGDGVVFYDHIADRWVVTDFAFPAFPGTSFYECLGVSKTADPVAGGWWLYAVQVDPAHPSYLGDYPKFGLWQDAYYLTMNEFSNNTTFNGVRVYALDRASMAAGLGANAIGFSILPATLGDAYSLVPATFRLGAPPAGRDEYLLAINSSAAASTSENQVFVWRFHTDFVTPANATFGTGVTHAPNGTITVNSFVDAFTASGTLLVPQPGTATKLDTLGDKLMYPLYYQNLGGTESLWAVHTINNSGPTAIRWYQFDVTGGGIPAAPAQQQTFDNAADGLYRWMPSLALDVSGNLAINYAAGNGTVSPSIRYAARKPADAASTLAQGEAILIAGGGSQTHSSGRWGDYSANGVDFSDGCTFWMAGEYYTATSSSTWGTRIGAFKFPDCAATPLNLLSFTAD